jgi:hypothetical protein
MQNITVRYLCVGLHTEYNTYAVETFSAYKEYRLLVRPLLEQGCQLKLKKNPLKTPDFSQKIS